MDIDSPGPKLIFTTNGDRDNSHTGCWSYVGKQDIVGGENGQAVNLGDPKCYNIGTVIHEVLHALGKQQYRINKFKTDIFRSGT